MSDASLIILASAMLSALLAFGLFVGWCAGRRLSGQRYDYLLFYSAYLVVINIPKLVMAMFGVSPPTALAWAIDVTEIMLIFLAAEAWSRDGRRRSRWLFVVPAIIAATIQQATGSEAWAIILGLSLGLILVLTVFNISKNAPWPVVVAVALSFGSWMVLELFLTHSGPPVGHAFGMLVKVMLMGAVMFANYERQHRILWRAAMMRRMAIGIMVGEIKNEDLEATDKNGRPRFAEFCRLASLDGINR